MMAPSARRLAVATAADGDVERLAARGEFLAAKNKYMLRADTWTVLGIDVSSVEHVGHLHLVLDESWQQDDAMDELAEETQRPI
jgi:predicted nucleotidyltransferase